MPEGTEVAADPETVVMGVAGAVGVRPVGTDPDTAATAAPPDFGAAADSTSVPHEPQSGHRPNHFGEE